MPVVPLDKFKERRANPREEFATRRVPQMDYLEKNFREAIKTLNAEQPRDAERIRQFERMADAIHTAAHSTRFTFDSTLQNALNTLETLPELMEDQDGRNLKLLRDTENDHPEFRNDLPQEDKKKDMLGHFRDLSSF